MIPTKRSFNEQITYWSSVVFLGVVLGLSLQIVQAWVEPTSTPPTGDIGAPVTTGSAYQYKTGNLYINSNGIRQTGLMVNGRTQLNNNLLLDGSAPMILASGSDMTFDIDNNNDQTGESFRWSINNKGTELMRLDTTGLGIGTNNPSYKLHVVGGNARVEGRLVADELRIPTDAGAGKVLTSNADGVARWADSPTPPVAITKSTVQECTARNGAKVPCEIEGDWDVCFLTHVNTTSRDEWGWTCDVRKTLDGIWVLEADDATWHTTCKAVCLNW